MGLLEQVFAQRGLTIPASAVHCGTHGIQLALLAGSDALALMPRQMLDQPFVRGLLQEVVSDEPMPLLTMGLYRRADVPLTAVATQFASAFATTTRQVLRLAWRLYLLYPTVLRALIGLQRLYKRGGQRIGPSEVSKLPSAAVRDRLLSGMTFSSCWRRLPLALVHLTRFDWIAGLCGIGSYARSDADTQRRHDVGLHTFRMSRTSFFGTECLRFQGQHFLWRSHASIEKWIVPGMTVLLARSTALCSGRCSLGRRCLSRQLRTALSVSLKYKRAS